MLENCEIIRRSMIRARRAKFRAGRILLRMDMYGVLHGVDEVRRQQGMLLERFGYGPVTTVSRTVWESDVAELIAYQDARPDQRAVLVVPAPIKAHYIWDLDPTVSAVRRLLEAGLQVYLVRWQRPRHGAISGWRPTATLPSAHAWMPFARKPRRSE